MLLNGMAFEHKDPASDPTRQPCARPGTGTLEFLTRELEIARLLIDRAMLSADPNTALRNIVHAEQAVTNVERFVDGATISDRQRAEIRERVGIERTRLGDFYRAPGTTRQK